MRQLAERCAEIGASEVTDNVIENIERRRSVEATRRGRDVTVDQLLALAYALGVAPAALMLPEDDTEYGVTATVTPLAKVVSEWFHGVRLPPLPNADSLAALIPHTDADRAHAVQDFVAMVPYAEDLGRQELVTAQQEVMDALKQERLDTMRQVAEEFEAAKRDIEASRRELRADLLQELREEFRQDLEELNRRIADYPEDGITFADDHPPGEGDGG